MGIEMPSPRQPCYLQLHIYKFQSHSAPPSLFSAEVVTRHYTHIIRQTYHAQDLIGAVGLLTSQ